MQVYTDPKLLDVGGAMNSLPPCNETSEPRTIATGTNGPLNDLRQSFPAPTTGKNSPKGSFPVIMAGATGPVEMEPPLDINGIPVNEKSRLSTYDNRLPNVGARGFEPPTSRSRTVWRCNASSHSVK